MGRHEFQLETGDAVSSGQYSVFSVQWPGAGSRAAPTQSLRSGTASGSVALGLAVALALAVSAFAATPVSDVETWSGGDTAGWSNSTAGVTLSNPGGYLQVQYGGQQSPVLVRDVARGGIAPNVKPTSISFKFTCGHVPPSSLRLAMHSSQEDHTWYVNLPPPASNQTDVFTVPVDFSAQWSMGPIGSEDQFQDDLRSIDWVGVYVRRHGDPALQNYQVDDFTLNGLLYTGDNDMDGMEDVWEDGYGLDSNNWRDASWNLDGDFMDNYSEGRAGTRPDDPDSFFTVEIDVTNEVPTARSVVLRWHSIPDRSYTVRRADTPGGEYLPIKTGIGSTPDTNEWVDAGSTNTGSFFYRIEVE